MTEQEIRKISSDFVEEIKSFYPNAEFAHSSFIGGEADDCYGDLKMELNFGQSVLETTDYNISNTKEFIHFTSLTSFYSILNSGEIRLNDLNQMNDPREFDLHLRDSTFGLTSEEISLFKRSLFLFSMCHYDEKFDDDFNMWRFYGKDGYGVGIVFELMNNEPEWTGYLFGRVNYDNQLAEEKVFELIRIAKRYQGLGLNTKRIPYLIGSLLLFHKSSIWSIENEYRVITFSEYDLDTFQTKFESPQFGYEKITHNLGKNGDKSAYLTHQLESEFQIKLAKLNNEVDRIRMEKFTLRLRIKKVVLGYNVSEDYLHKTENFLWRFCSATNTPIIYVEHSKLRKVFK
jgi:hypothetical protein